MAGSYMHLVDDENNFLGRDILIDNMGDAYEAIEECWNIIQILAKYDSRLIKNAQKIYIDQCRRKLAGPSHIYTHNKID